MALRVPSPRALAPVAVAMAMAVLAGCNDSDDADPVATTAPDATASTVAATTAPDDSAPDDSAPATTGPATTGPATTGPASTTTSEPLFTDTSQRTGDAVGDQSGQLVDARMAGQDGYDRFVLEVDGTGTPAYWVNYVERPVLDIPGDEVDIEGEALLAVTIFPARAVDIEDPDFTPTYDGPDRLTSDTVNIIEAVFVSDFEATMEWVLGLRAEAGFDVFVLSDPPRVVVDIATP